MHHASECSVLVVLVIKHSVLWYFTVSGSIVMTVVSYHPPHVPSEQEQMTKNEGHHVKIQVILPPHVQTWPRSVNVNLPAVRVHESSLVHFSVALLQGFFKHVAGCFWCFAMY